MWVEKYRPTNPNQLVGNEESRLGILRWLRLWKPGAKPAFLLGAPGTGKTTLVHAAAQAAGYHVVELNASDVRTKQRLAAKLTPALTTASLYPERQLIFLDEIDGIYGRADFGGMEFVQELIGKAPVPVVLAANVEDEQKFRKLLKSAIVFRFQRVPPRLIELYLRHVLEREGRTVPEAQIVAAARASKGDVRAALNTLQAAVGTAGPTVSSPPGTRDEQLALADALTLFFTASSSAEAASVLRTLDAMPRDTVRALYGSLVSSGLSGPQLTKALGELARADQLVGEIARTQEWRLRRYLDRILAYGLHAALPKGQVRMGDEELPWPMRLRLWNDSRALRDITTQLARLLHASRREVVTYYLPYLLTLLRGDKEKVARVSALLRLEEGAQKVLAKEAARGGGKA
jgi:replication factor C large subunit